MGAAAEIGIHYRNGQELVWAYGLRKSMSYEEARQLMAMLSQEDLTKARETVDYAIGQMTESQKHITSHEISDELRDILKSCNMDPEAYIGAMGAEVYEQNAGKFQKN